MNDDSKVVVISPAHKILTLKEEFLDALETLRECTDNRNTHGLHTSGVGFDIDKKINSLKKDLNYSIEKSVVQISVDIAYPKNSVYPLDSLEKNFLEAIDATGVLKVLGSGSEDLTDTYVKNFNFDTEADYDN